MRANEACEWLRGNFLGSGEGFRLEGCREQQKTKGGALLRTNSGCHGCLERQRLPKASYTTCPRARVGPGAGARGARRRVRGGATGKDPACALPSGRPLAGSRGARRGGGGASPAGPRRRRSARRSGESQGRRKLGSGTRDRERRAGYRGVLPSRGPRREVWVEPSPPSPAPAWRPPPAPARGLERASFPAPGLASRSRRSCGSRGEHQPPPTRDPLRLHHA